MPNVRCQWCHTPSSASRSADAAIALDESLCLFEARRSPKQKHDLTILSRGNFDFHLHRPAGIEPRPDLAGKSRARHGRRVGRRAVASEKFGAVSGDRALRFAGVQKSDPAGKLRAIGIARQ